MRLRDSMGERNQQSNAIYERLVKCLTKPPGYNILKVHQIAAELVDSCMSVAAKMAQAKHYAKEYEVTEVVNPLGLLLGQQPAIGEDMAREGIEVFLTLFDRCVSDIERHVQGD